MAIIGALTESGSDGVKKVIAARVFFTRESSEKFFGLERVEIEVKKWR